MSSSSSTPSQDNLLTAVHVLVNLTTQLSTELASHSTPSPSLTVGSRTALWDTHDGPLEKLRLDILKQTQLLERLVLGPHGYLHDFVSANWEYGALYVLLEYDVLEAIPLEPPASPVAVEVLAGRCGLPVDKLLRICRLGATSGILTEPEEGVFGHTAVSECVVRDAGLKSFLGFQLYETRGASMALAGSFQKPNPYWTGQAAFELAWGAPMYEWHSENEKHGKRFAHAMERVSNGLDPGNGMIIDFLSRFPGINDQPGPLVVEVEGRAGSFSCQLAEKFPFLRFEVQDTSEAVREQGKASIPAHLSTRITFQPHDPFTPQSATQALPSDVVGNNTPGAVSIFLLRSRLWSMPDEQCVRLLRSFETALRHRPVGGGRPPAVLAINDLVSPRYRTFEPHVERAFRRRDVTLMTMHNAKQRTSVEWMAIIEEALPGLQVTYTEKASSHSCRGLWVVKLQDEE